VADSRVGTPAVRRKLKRRAGILIRRDRPSPGDNYRANIDERVCRARNDGRASVDHDGRGPTAVRQSK